MCLVFFFNLHAPSRFGILVSSRLCQNLPKPNPFSTGPFEQVPRGVYAVALQKRRRPRVELQSGHEGMYQNQITIQLQFHYFLNVSALLYLMSLFCACILVLSVFISPPFFSPFLVFSAPSHVLSISLHSTSYSPLFLFHRSS